jgi:exopolysaccharide biosynthesis polyprenyl glycosylphosphotransferase
MTYAGTFIRRHFEPLVLSAQVLVDLIVVLAACLLAYQVREYYIWDHGTQLGAYREVFLLTGAVCLVCFHSFRMYSPLKSLLNVEEFKAIVKSTATAFLVVFTLIMLLRPSTLPAKGGYSILVVLHDWFDIEVDPDRYSRLTVVMAFALILVLTTVSRFVSFRLIQMLHKRGIGNRNALIVGTGETAIKLQKKFVLVPTLGLNLIGFVTGKDEEVGGDIWGVSVLGKTDELDLLISRHKISEVFVAAPEESEEYLMAIVERLEHLGVVYRVVPRFYHFMSHKVRIENLDSIPLISRPDRRPAWFTLWAKRCLDILIVLAVMIVALPFFLISAALIKRESEGPAFFYQTRIGLNGKPFKMIKFRTMHEEHCGDGPKPKTTDDPRVTNIGRWLRRYSLDELPQLFNVLKGEMSIVGPRPEMPFIVAKYGPLQRERLRVRPGLTGLWQISYARSEAIHANLDYDIYYIEHQSILLDLVIISLTMFAVAKGTGAT